MDTNIVLSQPNVFDASFINQVFSNCDISQKTRQDYLHRINRFRQFVQDNGGLDRNTLLSFKRFLASNNQISVATKNKHFTVAVVFLKQLFRLGVLKFDLGQGVRGFRVGSSFKTNGFTPDEVKRIVASLNEMKNVKTKAAVSLKMLCGLRDVEIVRLIVEDINLADGFIAVHGKGRDDKSTLPIIPQMVQILREYLESTGKRSGYLFTSDSKRNRGQHLTTKTVWLMVREFLDELGINRKPHTFRSLFTTTLCEKMPNLFDVINFTRHKNIQTLQSYVNQIHKNRSIPRYKDAFSEFVIN